MSAAIQSTERATRRRRRYANDMHLDDKDCEPDVDTSELLHDGSNLVQTKQSLLQITGENSDLIDLALLRQMMLNIRDTNLTHKFPAVNARLCEQLTFDERKRIIVVLNSVEGYGIDTLPNYLGCLRIGGAKKEQHTFLLASGRQVAVARLLAWLCDNSLGNYTSEKMEIARNRQTKGLAALSRHFTVHNTCHTDDCVNPLHYQRGSAPNDKSLLNRTTHAASGRDVHEDEHETALAERTMSRESYVMTPIESMIKSLHIADDLVNMAAFAHGMLTDETSFDADENVWRKPSAHVVRASAPMLATLSLIK